MNINFILPSYSHVPVGGYKVVYEYANRLSGRGHQVAVVHPWNVSLKNGPVDQVKKALWPYKTRLLRGKRLVPWFPVRSDVQLLLVPDLCEESIPDADFVFASAWQTAELVRHYPSRKGKKLYLIYDYEFWMTATKAVRRRMAATFRSGFAMIATSPAVQEMLAENGAVAAAYIPCGLDLSVYKLEAPIENRTWGTIGFPVREQKLKGTADAIEALETVKRRRKEPLQVKAFGSVSTPALPRWITYNRFPSDIELREFYNSVSVFMFPSHFEGWGLPGAEALACGAALVASDSVGLRDYAKNGSTALLVPRKRPDMLARSVEFLLEDDVLRQHLARQGHAHVQQYTWTRAVDALEDLLLSWRVT